MSYLSRTCISIVDIFIHSYYIKKVHKEYRSIQIFFIFSWSLKGHNRKSVSVDNIRTRPNPSLDSQSELCTAHEKNFKRFTFFQTTTFWNQSDAPAIFSAWRQAFFRCFWIFERPPHPEIKVGIWIQTFWKFCVQRSRRYTPESRAMTDYPRLRLTFPLPQYLLPTRYSTHAGKYLAGRSQPLYRIVTPRDTF